MERRSDKWRGDHSPIAGVYCYTSLVHAYKCTHDTQMPLLHTCTQPCTHMYWIVPINALLVVSKNLTGEKLALETDCLSRHVSVLKCPLLLLSMRQCSLCTAD